jgi:hypothetical protein
LPAECRANNNEKKVDISALTNVTDLLTDVLWE